MSIGVDEKKLEALANKVMNDVAGAVGVLMAYLGDQAGVYRELDEGGPGTLDQLAERTGLNPKYLHEWLGSNAAAGYVTYDPEAEIFSLSPEQAMLLSREGQPACMQGFLQSVVSQFETHEKALNTFKSGLGRPWGDHAVGCFCGTDRFFRPAYAANLVEHWIPSLSGVEQKLKSGAKIADIACGQGSSTILMAQAYPDSVVCGFDFHEPSIAVAREKARAAGLGNVEFHVARAQDYPGTDYDFVCIFDALHDMGDPVGAARHIRDTLAPNGTFMLVEPRAGDRMQDNLHPLGQIYYGFSTTVCTPASLAQEVGRGLGAQAGPAKLTEVLHEAGFSNVRLATDTPANMVLEVTP